ncbi:fibronectin type III domain-containing protein 7-like [Heptranchias perlo]|uniref:fibronectin type III domain-containing protein 7-like n=1 Tax=Heptranchias perlo TaxID=212740 RepID=UPI00355A119A
MFPEPCTPQSVDAALDCTTNIALVSWNFSNSTRLYTATAAARDGHQYSCSTPDTWCEITDLHCDEWYNVTVTAHNDNCNSLQSLEKEIKAVPCDPINPTAYLDCDVNAIEVFWDNSDGAASYVVIAENSDGLTQSCNTTDTNCELTNLQCGQIYNISIIGLNEQCNTLRPSKAIAAIETVPCPPQNVEAYIENNTALISWELSNRTVSYTVTAEGSDGHTTTCTTSEINCQIPALHCSQTYTITAQAFDDNCNSKQSSSYDIGTAPCAPEEIIANVDCNSNRVVVSWGRINGAISYGVTAEGSDGHTHTHNTTETRHEMLDLHCGQPYTITITTLSYGWNDIASTSVQIQTAPCIPENLTAELNCDSNAVSFSWDDTDGAKLYTVTARDSQRVTALFNTSDTKAQIPHLQCGEYYTISVLATDNICKSPQSAVVNVHAVPCPPQSAKADLDCANNIISLHWDQSKGAESYIVTAKGGDSYKSSYNTTNTSYEVKEVECGETLTMNVAAMNEKCTSSIGSSVTTDTVPCDPQNVDVRLDCNLNTALVSWDYSKGALWYTAIAEGPNGNIQSCRTSETSCRTPMLLCGQLYSVYVIASDSTCNQSQSSIVEIQTVAASKSSIEFVEHDIPFTNPFWMFLINPAPCSPQNVSAYLDCPTHTTSVLWEQSDGAMFYIAIAEGMEGDRYPCNATETSCEIIDLPCGQIYSITILAMDEICTSLPSPAFEIQTVPCIPQNVVAHMNCESNNVSVFWDPSNGTESYIVTAEGSNGHRASCNATDTECEITDVYCGRNYYITVQAIRMQCNSSQSSAFTIKTGDSRVQKNLE